MKKIISLILALIIVCLAASSCAKDGLSAYDIAVQNGFVGTEAEWIASLKGDKGEKGETGETGIKGDTGSKGQSGQDGKDGANGKDAPRIVKSYVNEDLHLIVEMSDGTVIDAGYVGVDLGDGSGTPTLSESELCIVPASPYIINCNLVGVSWVSDDTDVVRVTEGGLVIGISEGEATVTATSRTGESASCKVRVANFDYSVNANGNVTIEGYLGSSDVIVIPDSINGKTVDEIGRWSFLLNEDIKELHLSDSVKVIGEGAFSACSNLRVVTLGNSLTHIENTAFSGCESLEAIILPDSLEHIGQTAFNMCTSLSEIAIPSKITRLNGATFNYCSGLTKIDFGSLEHIGEFDFHGCDSLESITVPASVVSVGDYAFAECGKLKDVVFENHDVLFGNDVFTGSLYQPDFGIVFEDVERTMYAHLAYTVRSTPNKDTNDNAVGMLTVAQQVEVTGIYYENEAEGEGWARIIFNGNTRYVRIFCLKDTPPETEQEPEQTPEQTPESTPAE